MGLTEHDLDVARRMAHIVGRRVGLSREDQEDAAQDAVVRLLVKAANGCIPGGDGRQGCEGYATVTARNAVLEITRKRARQPLVSGTSEDGVCLLDLTPAPEPDRAPDADLSTRLLQAYRSLSEIQQDAVALYCQDLNGRDAASRLGIAESAYKSRVDRGLARIAWYLGTTRPKRPYPKGCRRK